MTPTVDGARELPVRPRRRLARLTAAGVTVGVAAAAIVGSTGATAAAATKPQAQSVGNFLDATVGGNTLDAIAKLQYATAVAPGKTSAQNPLDATVLNAINLPLTGALQLPSIAGIKLGAVNQVAKANTDGSSYGASGAVQNSGGVSVGGNNNAFPANATIDLSAAGLTGNSPVPIPGAGSLDALGGVKATIGGVAALASTPKGYGKAGSTTYQIANVDLSIGSPALGGLLKTVLTPVQTLVSSLTTQLGQALPASCKLTSVAALSDPIVIDGGTITIDGANATIKISLGALLKQLGLDLNNLPANTDLIDYLLAYLSDPKGLTKGLESVVNGIVNPLKTEFTNCSSGINAIPILGPITTGLINGLIGQSGILTTGQTQIEGLVNSLVGTLSSAGGGNPLAPLANGLKNLIDIGVNVQPNGKAGTYKDPLAATPKQGTPVVDGQTIVRAIELNIAGAASGLGLGGGLPTLGSLGLGSLGSSFAHLTAARLAAPRQAAAAGTGIATLALANAAAGPSAAPAVVATPTPTPTTTVPSTAVPTGVPAGAAGHQGGGSPALPIVVVLVGLVLAGGGVTAYRFRTKFTH